MKKILFTLLLTLCLLPVVNAEETYTDYQLAEQDFIPLNQISTTDTNYDNYIKAFNPTLDKLYLYSDFTTFYKDSKNRVIFDNLYEEISPFKEHAPKGVSPNYRISVVILSASSTELKLHSVIMAIDLKYNNSDAHYRYSIAYSLGTYYELFRTISQFDGNGNFNNEPRFPYFNTKFFSFSPFHDIYTSDTTSYKVYYPLFLFETNYPYTITNTLDTYSIYDLEGNLKNTYSAGDERPVYFPEGFSRSVTEVNLDDYEYVILSLKDYSQTESFTSLLAVKGMVGITPVYEYGTVEKAIITDRCNALYEDYTSYSLSVSKADLTNNAVYYVKACSENSSFKFDNTIFDITYITAENVDNPVVTIGGKEYVTIPFEDLSNSSNENEENNFIPGQSENAITGILDNFDNFSEGIWSAITSFMGLATKFFNTLPPEFRALSVAAFTTLIIIAIIKFIRG